MTDQTARITSLWNGSWIAALIVGVITWGLILWCVAAYRKRKDDHVLPVQTRYHLPLEIMYTAVPIVMVLVLFYYTDRDMTAIKDLSAEPDVEIQVIGKQWSWDFNYLTDDVYESGQHEANVGDLRSEDEIEGAPAPRRRCRRCTCRSTRSSGSSWTPATSSTPSGSPRSSSRWT